MGDVEVMMITGPSPVTWNSIPLRWSLPSDIGTNLRLDWKLDDGDDQNWPNDTFNGGVMQFAPTVNSHNFIPIPGRSYAFRTRREDTGQTSINIIKRTAPLKP